MATGRRGTLPQPSRRSLSSERDEAMTLSEISELALFTIFVFALVMVIVTLLRKK